MSGFIDYLFGPLPRDYCIWFYFLSILGYIWLIFFIISALYLGITKRKGSEYWMSSVAIALGYAIFYFQNRLLHSMCISK